MNTLIAQLPLPKGALPPDDYIVVGEINPSDDHVVCRHRDGTVASRFGERYWDMSAYQDDERLIIWDWGLWEGSELTSHRAGLIRDDLLPEISTAMM